MQAATPDKQPAGDKQQDKQPDKQPEKPVLEKLSNRPYSVIVWGSSGYTGRLCCECIVRNYQVRLRMRRK